MSLTRMLMNDMYGVYEGSEVDKEIEAAADEMDVAANEDVSEAWIDSAFESHLFDIYRVEEARLYADVIAEVSVIKEGSDPVVLLEGIFKGAFEKIKNAFKKLWAKIKSWFAAIKRQFLLLFTSGKKFIDTFKKELENKNKTTGFSYTGRKYSLKDGDGAGEKISKEVDDLIDSLVVTISKEAHVLSGPVSKDGKSFDIIYTGNTVTHNKGKTLVDADKDVFISYIKADGVKIPDNIKDTDSSTEMQDKLISAKFRSCVKGSPSNLDELNEQLTSMYLSGNDINDTEEIESFGNISKSEMMTIVSDGDKTLRDITKSENDFDKMMKKIIAGFDKVQSKDFGENGTAQYKKAQLASKLLNVVLVIGKVPTQVKHKIYSACIRDCERVLKGFLRWKPAKEGYDFEEGYAFESTGSSVIDDAISMLRF